MTHWLIELCCVKYFEQTSTQEWSKWSVKKKTNKKSNTGKRKWIRMGIVEDGYRLTGNI